MHSIVHFSRILFSSVEKHNYFLLRISGGVLILNLSFDPNFEVEYFLIIACSCFEALKSIAFHIILHIQRFS